MGLFDFIKCNYPLPNSTHQGLLFQTKSLDCSMSLYTITKEGRLTNSIEYPVFSSLGNLLVMNTPYDTITSEKDMDYHGDIAFYKFKSGDIEVQYKARFTNGQLESIKEI